MPTADEIQTGRERASLLHAIAAHRRVSRDVAPDLRLDLASGKYRLFFGPHVSESSKEDLVVEAINALAEMLPPLPGEEEEP